MMKVLKLFLVTALIVLSFIQCSTDNTTATIEGLWISTEETSSQFGGANQVALFIHRDSTNQVTSRAFFLRDDEFKMEWKFTDVTYDSAANKISMLDMDLDTLICSLDAENEMLKGAVHVEESKRPLNFARTDNDLTLLFYPRTPNSNGQIVYRYQQPEHLDNNLQTDSIFKFVKDSSAVDKLMDRIMKEKFGRLESLLIIKDQKFVLEEYFFGYDRTKLHPINSCTKSVTSLLLGIALNRHEMSNVNQSIFNFLPQYDSLKTPVKEKIMLQDVLTMTAGFEEEDDFEDSGPENFIRYILRSSLETKPGEEFRYSGKCSNLLCGIIYTLENRQADEFANEVLFNKLGISDFNWEKENGVLPCDAGLELYPRDMAKIGLLVLNDGSLNGEQIVPKEWIAESTKPYVTESEFFDYGYQWWYRSKQNKSWWKNPVHGSKDEHDMFLALGAGGQYIMVIKDLDMVIVTTSSDYNNDGMALQKVPMVIEEIVPIFKDASL